MIRQVGPEAAPSIHAIRTAARRVDDPSLPVPSVRRVTAQMTAPREPTAYFLAEAAGRPVGYSRVQLWSPPNDGIGYGAIAVAPEFRRQGYGTRLLEAIADHARAAGRTTLVLIDLPDNSSAPAFAAARGFVRNTEEIRSVLELATLDWSLVDEVRVPTAGYRLISWQGRSPATYVAGIAAAGTAMADAPSGEVEVDYSMSADDWYVEEDYFAHQGLLPFTTIAFHEASGEVAAFTTLVVDPDDPGFAYQQQTVALPGHRGHRLGIAVKAEAIRQLTADQPRTRRIVTWNHMDNSHMLSVNRELGFEADGTCGEWALGL